MEVLHKTRSLRCLLAVEQRFLGLPTSNLVSTLTELSWLHLRTGVKKVREPGGGGGGDRKYQKNGEKIRDEDLLNHTRKVKWMGKESSTHGETYKITVEMLEGQRPLLASRRRREDHIDTCNKTRAVMTRAAQCCLTISSSGPILVFRFRRRR